MEISRRPRRLYDSAKGIFVKYRKHNYRTDNCVQLATRSLIRIHGTKLSKPNLRKQSIVFLLLLMTGTVSKFFNYEKLGRFLRSYGQHFNFMKTFFKLPKQIWRNKLKLAHKYSTLQVVNNSISQCLFLLIMQSYSYL